MRGYDHTPLICQAADKTTLPEYLTSYAEANRGDGCPAYEPTSNNREVVLANHLQ
jgi:hypothetical protein